MGTGTATRASRPDLPGSLRHQHDATACRAYASDRDTAARHAPRAVVQAGSADDVLALVQWANETGTGIVPVSSTGTRRRGDTVPVREGSVIADLSGMKRLIHADPRDKIAIIEPGVDFGTIDALLAPHGLRAYRPLAPRSGKSVIASYLEREPLIASNDHWDVGDPFGGTELVLGAGRTVWTGSVAEGRLPERLAKGHRNMVPVGPSHLDLLRVVQGSQGSLAIMTWAAIYCERVPSAETARFCCADTLPPVLELARELLRRRLGNVLFIVNRVQLALLLGADGTAFDTLIQRLPEWTLFASLSAHTQRPAEKMAWQQADLEQCAARAGVQVYTHVGDGHGADALNAALRQPQAVALRDRALGEQRELFFLQQLDKAEALIQTAADSLQSALPLGVYLQPMAQGVSCHIELSQPLERTEPDRRAGDARWHETARRCAEAGAFFSRPYGRWSDIAFARETGTRSMMTMTKHILDPKGVMNPGRLPY